MDLEFIRPSPAYITSFSEALSEEPFMHMALTNKDKITAEQFAKAPKDYFNLLQEIEQNPVLTPSGDIFEMDEHRILWAVKKREFIGGFSLRYAHKEKSKEFLDYYVGHCGLSVRPSQRNKGYGRSIWGYAREDAKKRGLAYIVGGAHPDNVASWKAIEKAGGQFSHIAPDRYGWGEGKMYKLYT